MSQSKETAYEAIMRLKSAGAKVKFGKPIANSAVHAQEAKLGFKLPPTYAHFLTEYGPFKTRRDDWYELMPLQKSLTQTRLNLKDYLATAAFEPGVKRRLETSYFFQGCGYCVNHFYGFDSSTARADGEMCVQEYDLEGEVHWQTRFTDFHQHMSTLVDQLIADGFDDD